MKKVDKTSCRSIIMEAKVLFSCARPYNCSTFSALYSLHDQSHMTKQCQTAHMKKKIVGETLGFPHPNGKWRTCV